MAQMARFAPQPSAVEQRQLLARWQAQQGWLLHLGGRMEAARQHFREALNELELMSVVQPMSNAVRS